MQVGARRRDPEEYDDQHEKHMTTNGSGQKADVRVMAHCLFHVPSFADLHARLTSHDTSPRRLDGELAKGSRYTATLAALLSYWRKPYLEGTSVKGQPTRRHRADTPSSGSVLLVGSSGGHLAQLVALRPWWEERDRAWVTFDGSHARSLLEGEQVEFAYFPTTRNIPNLLRNFVVAARVLLRRRPDVVVSSGAAVAIPFFVIARVLGIQTVYVEVYDRIDSRTVSGRICRPLASAFLVQWDAQQQMYPGSVVIGPLL
jgi:hypothetical protein